MTRVQLRAWLAGFGVLFCLRRGTAGRGSLRLSDLLGVIAMSGRVLRLAVSGPRQSVSVYTREGVCC